MGLKMVPALQLSDENGLRSVWPIDECYSKLLTIPIIKFPLSLHCRDQFTPLSTFSLFAAAGLRYELCVFGIC